MANFPGTSEVRVSAKTATTVHFEIAYTDAAATYTVPVKAGMFVHSVGVVVKTAFNATTPTLTVGDGFSAAGYLDNTTIALATAATDTAPAVKLSRNAAQAFANGKYYAVDDTIDFVFSPGTGGTTGLLKGFVTLSSVCNDGITA